MAQPRRRITRTLALALVLSVAAAGTAAAQDNGFPTDKLFAALALAAGNTVCEMGAGDGELSVQAADKVGDQGRVYTSEVGGNVRTLEGRIAAAKRAHIEVVAGAADRTNFPDAACDALFMRNVYHHFEDPAAMNASISAALKPGGRLAIVDFGPPPGSEAAQPGDRDRDGSHGVTSATVARELRAAGFDVTATETGSGRGFMVVAVKRGS